MNYTREQAEQVLKDWDEFHKCSTSLGERLNKYFLDTKFPKLKNGMWVKWEHSGVVYVTDIEKNKGYGVSSFGTWYDNGAWASFKTDSRWQPASDEEVIEALEKYAKSIGLVEGARVKCLLTGCVYTFNESYILNCGNLWFVIDEDNACLVMQHGTWAAPIKSDLHKKLEELKKQAEDEGMKLVITFENK
jgi:hypothetical protein